MALGVGLREKLLAKALPQVWDRFFREAERSFFLTAFSACEMGVGLGVEELL